MTRERSKGVWLFIGVGALVAIILSGLIYVGTTGPIISGYGGLTADIMDIEADGEVYNTGLTAGVDKLGYFNPWPVTTDPTGLRMEIQGRANILETIKERPDVNQTIDNGDGTFTHKWWKVNIVKCEITATVRTEGIGLDPAYDTMFTIRLQENQFDVFTDADEVMTYILEVYTTTVSINSSLMQLSPSSEGYYFPMTPLNTNPIPDWMAEAGYQESLSQLSSVSFVLEAERAQPSSWMGMYRTEQAAYWVLGIDMLTFGYWEETGPYRKFVPQPSEPTFLEMLGDAIATAIDVMGPMMFMVMIIVVGVVIIVLVFQFGGIAKGAMGARTAGKRGMG